MCLSPQIRNPERLTSAHVAIVLLDLTVAVSHIRMYMYTIHTVCTYVITLHTRYNSMYHKHVYIHSVENILCVICLLLL